MTAVQARRRATHFVAALAALVLVGALVVADAGAAKAVDGFSIAGHVTLPVGAPAGYMNGVNVHAVKTSGTYYQGNATPSEVDGSYQISGLPAGTYQVTFEVVQYWDGDSYEVPELVGITYDARYDPDLYTPVDLTVGDQEAVDATLGWSSTISGTITLTAEIPSVWLGGVTVWANSDNGPGTSAFVDPATGAYTIEHLAPGNYLVSFENGTYFDGGAIGATNFLEEYYNDVYVPGTATYVPVPLHSAVAGINAQLSTIAHFTTAPVPTITALKLTAGSVLGSSTGTWTPAPTFSYRWKRDGAPISGAIKSQYTLTTADRGKKITLTITGSKTGFTTVSKTSAAKYIPKVFTTTKTPTITGIAASGHTLTAHGGTWSPTATFSYQWYRSGVKIVGATKYTYKLTTADKGKRIVVSVTGKRTGWLSVTKTSAYKTIAK